MKSKVLILGGRAPVALDHARRFARQGWQVTVADSIPCLISGASRAVDASLRIASPRHAPAQFAADLASACDRHRFDLILPTCEEVFFLSRYRRQLPDQVRVLADDFDTLRAVHSKWQFLALARGCCVNVPDSTLVGSIHEAREWAQGAPIVLKPEFSRFGVHVRLYGYGVPDDAPPLPSLGNWVAQRYVSGTEYCSYSVADRGQLRAHSLYRPTWRMNRSSSFYFEPARIEAIHTFVANFVRKLDFTGQVSFDWIQDASGNVSVLECNPRATSGCHLFPLDAPLPAALAGTLDQCIEPRAAAPRMISAVMLSAGLIDACRRRDVRRWSRDYRNAADVIGVPDDRRPIAGALIDLMSYARLALAQRCNMREAATRDIEWDGEALPDV
ncbi:ATP-grasp domain-containing protein [Paraburkholderia sp. ZP32-5]|uniref:ATP-grasp domain-containing protein n=1 Tax=Paraburkholderia sp. ZP32-5 TaxID=2883245 RepID=UPI001F1F15F1|nr:ATP-grasp domain-containing protein [Paraburkholderia sp. ZP32-5]